MPPRPIDTTTLRRRIDAGAFDDNTAALVAIFNLAYGRAEGAFGPFAGQRAGYALLFDAANRRLERLGVRMIDRPTR